jgi:hypothetical protein
VALDVVALVLAAEVDGLVRLQVHAKVDVALDVVALVLAAEVDGLVRLVVHAEIDMALDVVADVLAAEVDGLVRLQVHAKVDVALDVLVVSAMMDALLVFAGLVVYVLLLHGDPPFELLELDHKTVSTVEIFPLLPRERN